MSEVLIIQNTKLEGPGAIGDFLLNDGFKIKTIFPKKEKITHNDFSLLVVLGGPQSANDGFPYLREEEDLIRDFAKQKKPILGICLGSQLIAKAFGAKIIRAEKKEIGFYDDLSVDKPDSKLFLGFENPFTVFHWHGDTFELPKNAIRLVHSVNIPNQAFQLSTAVGLQFHLEVNPQMVNLWLENTEEKLEQIPYINPEKIRQEIDGKIPTVQNNMKIFYKNFKSEFNL